jgi:hypothetical protein
MKELSEQLIQHLNQQDVEQNIEKMRSDRRVVEKLLLQCK